MQVKIFSDNFLDSSSQSIHSEIKEKGYFFYENALTQEFLDVLTSDIALHKFSCNENKPSGIYTVGQYYFVNLLSISQVFYNYVTSRSIRDICTSYFGHNFRLKALRYYETVGGFHMQWHTDNKTDREFAEIPGLIFIFYVSDVDDGEFQYVEGSQNWSSHAAYNNYSDAFIAKNHSAKVRSFKGAKGSLIVYNTYGVHRAKPSPKSSSVRRSVFFQVDEDISNSEPIIINASFHKNREPWVDQFLGFGLDQTYDVFPTSNLKMLPKKIKLNIVSSLTGSLVYNFARDLIFSSKLMSSVARKGKKMWAGKNKLDKSKGN